MRYQMTLAEFTGSGGEPRRTHPAVTESILRGFAELYMDEIFEPRLREKIPEMTGEMLTYAGARHQDEPFRYRFGDCILRFRLPVGIFESLPMDRDCVGTVPDGYFDLAMLPYGFISPLRPKKKEHSAEQSGPDPTTPRKTPVYSLAAQLHRIRKEMGAADSRTNGTLDEGKLAALTRAARRAASGRLDAYTLHSMLLKLPVRDLLDYLESLPEHMGLDFDEIRGLIGRAVRHEPRRASGIRLHFDRSPEVLTVGNLLLKAGDFIAHPDDYDAFEDTYEVVVLGEWMLAAAMVWPFEMLEQNGLFTSEPLDPPKTCTERWKAYAAHAMPADASDVCTDIAWADIPEEYADPPEPDEADFDDWEEDTDPPEPDEADFDDWEEDTDPPEPDEADFDDWEEDTDPTDTEGHPSSSGRN
ncbi:MAG: hypothetical protein IJ595_06355 [Oscillospiraceae bacterium]|nr:hypothetical protein [Oscillospiraceae bacterium]